MHLAPQVAAPSSTVDVRPLTPVVRGSLRLAEPDAAGRRFVSAASGIAAAPGGAWVVSDELSQLVSFVRPAATDGVLSDALPPQAGKADLEAIVAVPGGRGDGALALLALGSGSKRDRARGVLRELTALGAPAGAPLVLDLAPLYARLERELSMGVNIEGAVWRDTVAGAELLLLHRGKAAGERNVVFTLAGEAVLAAARAGRAVGADVVRASHTVELGSLAGQPLGFADARALPDGRIAFLASAEGGKGTGDGAIVGSVVGVLDAQFAVRALRPLTGPARKAEGIERTFLLDPTASPTTFTIVTDADDPTRASEVLEVDLA